MSISFLALVVTFLLGGITFLPLLVATFLGFLYYTSPVVHVPLKTGIPTTDAPPEEEAEIVTLFRAGWLTVRRTYEPLVGPNEGYVGMMVSGYRSFMDNRSRDPRHSRPKDKFFAVLKQNVLFLYENEEQVDCWAAVEVTSHEVLLYPEDGPDGELFVKRNAMCLRPKALSVEALVKYTPASQETSHDLEPGRPLPWFLFAKVNSDKEDWFHSLIQASKLGSPTAAATLAKDRSLFDSDDMARLVEGIDQQPDSIPMRWLNAMLGRVFLSVYRTETLEAYLISRIVRKLKRVKTPSILSEVQVREVNVGSSAPFFSKPMLKELTPDGHASMEVHVSYVGEMRITIETVATINLGARFKPYSVRLVLAVVLKEIEGTLLLKIKKPPSNRMWFGFSTMPRMVLSVEPVVSTRQIKWSMITSPIESRIREVILESIVVPHMDDFPFFDSRSFFHRGGIWGEALRKERDLNTPAGGSGDEAHAIGHDDIVEDEIVGEPILSTARQDSAESIARQRLGRRRSSDGDIDSRTATEGTAPSSLKSGLASSASSLSNFSLSSWREGKKDSPSNPMAGEKKRSWFTSSQRTTTGSATPPLSVSPISRASTVDSSTTEPAAVLSASRLRDILTKRALDREKEKENAGPISNDGLDDGLAPPPPPTLSALSLTAPSTPTIPISTSPSYQETSSSIFPLLNEDSGEGKLTASPNASVPDLVLQAPSPISAVPLSKSASAASLPLRSESSSPIPIPPALPSRNSSTSKLLPSPPPPPPRRHLNTQSESSFASTVSTASILSSWRKAADKKALEDAVDQAKDTMKRWGQTWNARKHSGAENSDAGAESDGGTASSPPQDQGRTLPSGRNASRSHSHSPSRDGAGADGKGNETYRDYRVRKEYYGGLDSTPSSSSTSTPSSRKRRESNPPGGLLSPSSPPQTTVFTTPTFAPGSLAKGTAYQPAKMMMVPGISDYSRKQEVASDHVSGTPTPNILSVPATPVNRTPSPTPSNTLTPNLSAAASTPIPAVAPAIPPRPATEHTSTNIVQGEKVLNTSSKDGASKIEEDEEDAASWGIGESSQDGVEEVA